MSSGAFTRVAYISTRFPATTVFPIRVQPETTGLSINVAGAPVVNQSGQPVSAINSSFGVRVSGGKRAKGLKAGSIRFTFDDPLSQPLYKPGGVLSLPILNNALLGAKEGDTGTYLGSAVTVVGITTESGRL